MSAETKAPDLDAASLARLLKLVYKFTGITMVESKKSMLEGRLRRRLKELKMADYATYLSHVEANKSEHQEFINLVTTNETSFFRTTRVWDFFQKEFLPKWLQDHGTKMLKIWSAASSTGEEVYTIAMCCQEFKLKNPAFQYQIHATDIDTKVLANAEKGVYQGRSIDNLRIANAPMLEKYFKEQDGVFKIANELKERITFKTHNLFQAPPQNGHFDLVFLRNVLIYFEAADQEKVLAQMNKALNKDGLLVIGESESLTRLATNFKYKLPLIYEPVAA